MGVEESGFNFPVRQASAPDWPGLDPFGIGRTGLPKSATSVWGWVNLDLRGRPA